MKTSALSMSSKFLVAVRTSIVLPCLAVLAACNGLPINAPPPDKPQLESVNLRGQRVCGTFSNSTTTFTFACDPLPTSIGTGWQLTPLRKPHPTNPNWSIPNRGIVFTVSTPSLTSIEVAYRASSGARFVLSQVSPGPGRPQMLQAGASEVEVASTDNGVRKTWTIAAQTNSCLEKMELEIVNISRGARSDTLPIHILRIPDETLCITTPAVGSGISPTLGTSRTGGVGMGTTTGTSASGSCPGGASRTMFQFCEVCSTTGGSWAQYTGIESCSLTDAIAHMGYGPSGVRTLSGFCSLSQTGSKAQCEGGP